MRRWDARPRTSLAVSRLLSLVDTSRQRTAAGLLTTADLEAARVRYDVRWLLADSFRLDHVPGFREWRDSRFHAVQNLGGGAVIYEANLP